MEEVGNIEFIQVCGVLQKQNKTNKKNHHHIKGSMLSTLQIKIKQRPTWSVIMSFLVKGSSVSRSLKVLVLMLSCSTAWVETEMFKKIKAFLGTHTKVTNLSERENEIHFIILNYCSMLIWHARFWLYNCKKTSFKKVNSPLFIWFVCKTRGTCSVQSSIVFGKPIVAHS